MVLFITQVEYMAMKQTCLTAPRFWGVYSRFCCQIATDGILKSTLDWIWIFCFYFHANGMKVRGYH